MKLTEEQKKMVIDNINLVYFVINNNKFKIVNKDCISVGYLNLCKAVLNYNSDKGEFSTFAFSYIKNGIKTYIRSFELKIKIYGKLYFKCDTESLDYGLLDFIDNNEKNKLPSNTIENLSKIIPKKYHDLLFGIYENKYFNNYGSKKLKQLQNYIKNSTQYEKKIKDILLEAQSEL